MKVEKQRKALSQTEEERNHYLEEATEQAKRVEALLDEVRDAESLVYTYRKEMRDLETQLKQQQNLYAAVRNDRTGLARSLTEANDEIADLKGKLRHVAHVQLRFVYLSAVYLFFFKKWQLFVDINFEK